MLFVQIIHFTLYIKRYIYKLYVQQFVHENIVEKNKNYFYIDLR